MKKFIQIIHKKRLIAFIIKDNFKMKGVKFFTPDKFPQQLAYMNRPKGYLINSHIHPPTARQIKFTQEVLFIKKGKVRIDFYDKKTQYAESRLLEKGDIVFIVEGGHGFDFMKNTEIIEVKQGPFLKSSKPIRFEPVKKDKIKLKK